MIGPNRRTWAWMSVAWAASKHRRIRAVAHLLTGTSATVGLSLISITLTARALGPEQYGILALILTLGQACERLFSFQSWQPLIRYGATLTPERHRDDLRSLFKFGLLLDLAGSVAAWAVASLLALASHYVLGVSWHYVLVALAFLLSLLCNMNGTATAAFRLADRYRTVAYLQVVSALLRLMASVLAFALGWGVVGFAIVWAATQAAGSLLNIGFALHLQARLGVTRIVSARLSGMTERFPNVWGFTWGANISLTIWASAQQVDTLIVGWLVDPAAAGMFHIAKRISRVALQVGSQVEAVVYPDLSRLWAGGERTAFIRLLVQSEAILAGFGVICFITSLTFAKMVLEATAGAHFAAAAPLMSAQILAVAFMISGAASRAGLLAMGRQPAVLRTVLAAAATFYCLVIPLIGMMGAMGANAAHVLFGLVWLSGLTFSIRRGLRSPPSAATTIPVAGNQTSEAMSP